MLAMFQLRRIPAIAAIFLLALSLSVAQEEGVCKSLLGYNCLSKEEVIEKDDSGEDKYKLMVGGDPCFLISDKRVCFLFGWTLSLDFCECTEHCGCLDERNSSLRSIELRTEPKCDDSEMPNYFDCGGDWCKRRYSTEHTMCIYCGVNSNNCGKICQHGLTKDEEDIVLETHNALRRRVAKGQEPGGDGGMGQPPATNMKKLSWDPELATIAQRWADQCVLGHDRVRISSAYPYVGQNYVETMNYYLSFSNNNVSGMVELWYSEVNNFSRNMVGAFGSTKSVIGHYTQLVWAETEKIGCGFIQYPYRTGRTWYKMVLICNYGPAGNFLAEPIYKEGKTASECTNGEDDGLCL